MADILIKHGTVIDGSSSPGYRADVVIEGGRITMIGSMEYVSARDEIDARGLVVCPGFVDMHSHADESLVVNPTADSMVHQGITTAVVGMCGGTLAPLLPETRETMLGTRSAQHPEVDWEAITTFSSCLNLYRSTGISLNIVPMVGQGTIRGAVMGYSPDAATPEQIREMQHEVDLAMDAGAWGVSSGLIYPPSSYASTEELIEVVRPAGARRGYYFTHMRNEAMYLLESIKEAIRIGKETGTSVQIAHYKAVGPANWHLSAPGLALIDEARAEGLDITMDMYPYLASSSPLTSLLPGWAQAGGKDETIMRLADPRTRQEMRADMLKPSHPRSMDFDQIMIAKSHSRPELSGRYIGEMAREAGKDPFDWLFDTLIDTGLDPSMVGFAMSEENRRNELRHPQMMIGCDGYGLSTTGPLSTGTPHPRNYGTFPRVLAHYVREEQVLTLEEAIHKMCGLPAKKLRWKDRGLLREGYRADVTVFDPETVQDTATFTNPHQYPVGIPHVIVNGKWVIRDGKHTGGRPGMVLSR